MKKLQAFEQEIERISGRIEELEGERVKLCQQMAQVERKISDLRIEQAFKADGEADEKKIERERKPLDQLKQAVSAVDEKLTALKLARSERLMTYRDEAKEELDKEQAQIKREIDAKIDDIRDIGLVLLEKFYEIGILRHQSRELSGKFTHLSGKVDDKYANYRSSVVLPALKALLDNYAGDQAAVIPPYHLLYSAYENATMPTWVYEKKGAK
jgi:chromosome segregation ATPase